MKIERYQTTNIIKSAEIIRKAHDYKRELDQLYNSEMNSSIIFGALKDLDPKMAEQVFIDLKQTAKEVVESTIEIHSNLIKYKYLKEE